MPIEDILSDLISAGSSERGWRSPWAILGVGLGALIGGYIGFQSGILSAMGYGVVGAGIGWIIGVLFTGLFRVLALMAIFAVIIVAWYWLTGSFG